MSRSVSMSTCTAQLTPRDSHMLITLGKNDGKREGARGWGRGGGVSDKGEAGGTVGKEIRWWGWGGWRVTKKLKTNKISAAGKTQCLLHFGVRLASCSWGWAQHCRMTAHLSAFCLCSHQILRCIGCTGKRSGENKADCKGKPVSVDIWRSFNINLSTIRDSRQ